MAIRAGDRSGRGREPQDAVPADGVGLQCAVEGLDQSADVPAIARECRGGGVDQRRDVGGLGEPVPAEALEVDDVLGDQDPLLGQAPSRRSKCVAVPRIKTSISVYATIMAPCPSFGGAGPPI